MRQIMTAIGLTILLLLSSGQARGVEIGITGSIGIPRGCMDFSVNGAWFARMDIPFPVKPELVFNESFATKSEEYGGRLNMNVFSCYLLGRYIVASPFPKFSPHISVGGGLHLMSSFSGDDTGLGGQNKTTFVSKAHLFLGVDLVFTSKWFLSAQGRVTYPSDIIVDSGYLGVGVRL